MTASAARTEIEAAPDWAALRQEFPTTERFVYLDTARKALLPRRTGAAIGEWLGDVFKQAGADAFSMEQVEHTRAAVARLMGASPGTVALIKNTSEGMNILARGLALQPGDNVLVGEYEHENNTFPWRHRERDGIEVRTIRADADGRMPVEAYAERMDERTRVVAVAWVAYGNGYRADLRALSDLCRERDVRLVVDAMQAAGILATPISELGADAVVSGGHKTLLSLAGAGFMYVREDLIPQVTPPYAAKFSFTSNDLTRPELALAEDAHRFEYGNPNFLGIWVQRRSAEFIMELGLEHIERRVRALSTRLIEEAEAAGFRLRTPRPWHERAGIVSFETFGDVDDIVARLRARNIVVSAKDGHVRASVHVYNDDRDIETFLRALEEVFARA